VSQELKPKEDMQLGHYTLTVKLADGVFSETWLAEHMYLEGKETCMKIFTNDKFILALEKQKFLRVLREPLYLPYIDDFDPKATFPYLAQEVVKGRSLRQMIRERKQLTIETTYSIMKNVLIALGKLHQSNIPHLDLRPEHIIIDPQGNIKLLDYELGQVITSTIAEYYKEFSTKGTPLPKSVMRSLLYKSKQHRAGIERSTRADIFSLGIIFFEMLTGTYPTKKAELPSILVPEVGEKADQIFSGCCNRAEDYYVTCEEILKDVEEDLRESRATQKPGLFLIQTDTAFVSISTLVENKNYVDGKNISLLSKNIEEIMKKNLKFYAFDLKNIEYLNSSAIGFLAHFHDRVQNAGGTTVFFHVDRKVITILGALGLEKVFHIVPTAQEAESYLLSKRN